MRSIYQSSRLLNGYLNKQVLMCTNNEATSMPFNVLFDF